MTSTVATGHFVLAIAGGMRMQPERDAGIVRRLLVWLAQAARVYDTDKQLPIIDFGTIARHRTVLNLDDPLSVIGLTERPAADAGNGAAMAPAIEAALSLPGDDSRRVVLLVSDCHIQDVDATERAISQAPTGTIFVLVRVATNLEGLNLAQRLFGNRTNCLIIHGTDSRGRAIADVERIFNRSLLPMMQENA